MSIRRLVKHIISTVVLDKVYAHHFNRILAYGISRWRRDCNSLKSKYDNINRVFPNNLAICAIMKDEGPYLREWIEYHRTVGVEKFYLYDNDSTDDTKKILAPYIKSGLVEYTFFPGEKRQLPAYNDCIARFNNDAKWIAFVDLDEFIVPKEYETIPELLDSVSKRVTQVIIDWEIFGSCGHKKKPQGLVIENYTMRARKSWLYKSIVNPRMVFSMGCHEHNVAFWTYHVPRNVAQINHYYCKSWEEYERRKTRGDAWEGKAKALVMFDLDNFILHDKNEVYDDAILRFLPAVHTALQK